MINFKFFFSIISDTFESLIEEQSTIDSEQKKIDHQASILEKRLRKLMETGNFFLEGGKNSD